MCGAVLNLSVVSNSATPMDCSPSGSSVHGDYPEKNMEWVALPSSRGLYQPRNWTQVYHIAVNSLPSESPAKPKNIGVDSLFFLQGDLPNPGIEPGSPELRMDSLPAKLPEKPLEKSRIIEINQIANMRWIIKKQESSRKTSISASLTMPKPLTVWITINCGKFPKRWEYQTTWPASWEIYMQVRKQPLELDMEQQTGSK